MSLFSDLAARHVCLPGDALHPDPASSRGAKAAGHPPLDLPELRRIRPEHVLLKLSP